MDFRHCVRLFRRTVRWDGMMLEGMFWAMVW